MSEGWVSINRAVCEHYLWSDKPFTKGQAWIDLIIHANHKDTKIEIKGTVYHIKRGQQARSELTLAKEWGWSRGKIRRFLKMLKSDLMIVQRAEQHTSIITICNYKDFQDQQQTDGTTEQTPNGTPNEHQTDTKRYTDNNVNNVNNENNSSLDDDFSIKLLNAMGLKARYNQLRMKGDHATVGVWNSYLKEWRDIPNILDQLADIAGRVDNVTSINYYVKAIDTAPKPKEEIDYKQFMRTAHE